MPRLVTAFASVFVTALLACSSSSSDTFTLPPAPPAPPGGDPGGGPNGNDALAPPEPGKGIQLKMTTKLETGVETERCQFFKVPAGGLFVNDQKTGYGVGAHHILLFKTEYEEIPTEDSAGNKVDTSGVFECPSPNASWQTTGVVGGIQSRGSADLGTGLPKDVALKLEAGEVVLLNVHMLNTSTKPIDLDVRMNLYTVPAEQVKQEAGVTFWYNFFIKIPPMGSGRSTRMRCPFPKDVTLVNAQSHMHSRGSGYVAHFTPKDGTEEKIYEHSSYENVPVATWGAAGKQVKAGDSIEFGCKYTNKEARTVLQGPKSTDEMCMFLALYYPKSVAIDDCAPSDDYQGPPGLAAVHRGDGTADGAATMQCMGGAAQAGPIADQTGVFSDAFTTCLLDSCPKVGAPMTTAANCMFTEAFGKCTETCTANGAECGSCIQKECQPSFAELSTAKCN